MGILLHRNCKRCLEREVWKTDECAMSIFLLCSCFSGAIAITTNYSWFEIMAMNIGFL